MEIDATIGGIAHDNLVPHPAEQRFILNHGGGIAGLIIHRLPRKFAVLKTQRDYAHRAFRIATTTSDDGPLADDERRARSSEESLLGLQFLHGIV